MTDTTTLDYPAWPGETSPLDWYRLIGQAEHIRDHWCLGLASVWGHINAGDYATARDELDRVIVDIELGLWERRLAPLWPALWPTP